MSYHNFFSQEMMEGVHLTSSRETSIPPFSVVRFFLDLIRDDQDEQILVFWTYLECRLYT
jgi:hypothetical protein